MPIPIGCPSPKWSAHDESTRGHVHRRRVRTRCARSAHCRDQHVCGRTRAEQRVRREDVRTTCVCAGAQRCFVVLVQSLLKKTCHAPRPLQQPCPGRQTRLHSTRPLRSRCLPRTNPLLTPSRRRSPPRSFSPIYLVVAFFDEADRARERAPVICGRKQGRACAACGESEAGTRGGHVHGKRGDRGGVRVSG